MTKLLHERFYKHQVEEIKKQFDLNTPVAMDNLEDLKKWSIMEAKDYYLDELHDLVEKAQDLFDMISKDLEEEIYLADEEDADEPFDGAAEPIT